MTTSTPTEPLSMNLTKQEARLLVLVLERVEKGFVERFSSNNSDQLYKLYERLHLYSDSEMTTYWSLHNPLWFTHSFKLMTTTSPAYTSYGYDVSYEPMYCINRLNWFNIAKCARERMTENCHDTDRWHGERRSFYTALQRMEIDEVNCNAY